MAAAAHPLGLEYLSVFGLPLLDYAELAARLGCAHVSVNWGGAANRLEPHPAQSLRDDLPLRAKFDAALRDLGLTLSLVEGFAILPGAEPDWRADLDAVAALGARAICSVSLDKDRARTHDQFAALAEAAAARGLLVTTELGAGVVRHLADARAALEAVVHPAFALLVDAMHFFRRGGTVADLAALPPGAIGHVQLCDVPMPATAPDYLAEALFERRPPGEGELPLHAFVAALPAGVPIGLEIPVRSRFEAGDRGFGWLGESLDTVRGWTGETPSRH